MSHDDLTDDTRTDIPWFPWVFFAVLIAAVAWFATDGGKGSMPEPLSPPCTAVATVSGAPAHSPAVEPRTPDNCEEGP